jgi:hypothetical protein
MELVWEAEGGAQEEESLGIVSSRSLRRELTRHNTSGLLMQVPFFSTAPAGDFQRFNSSALISDNGTIAIALNLFKIIFLRA